MLALSRSSFSLLLAARPGLSKIVRGAVRVSTFSSVQSSSVFSSSCFYSRTYPHSYFHLQATKPLSQLPEHSRDDEYQNYGDPSFWDRTYAKKSEPLEWYQSYSDIAPLFKRYIPKSSRVLMVGCGNAEISADMVKDGYEDVTNIDNSSVVIEAMQMKYQNVTQLKYETMDVLDMSSFHNNNFDCIIDKGTLDAIMCVVGGPYNVGLMMAEVSRVLKPGGIYMLITTGNPESRLPLLNTQTFGWLVTLYILPQPDTDMDSEERLKAYVEPVNLNENGTYADNFVLQNPDSLFVFICRKP